MFRLKIKIRGMPCAKNRSKPQVKGSLHTWNNTVKSVLSPVRATKQKQQQYTYSSTAGTRRLCLSRTGAWLIIIIPGLLSISFFIVLEKRDCLMVIIIEFLSTIFDNISLKALYVKLNRPHIQTKGCVGDIKAWHSENSHRKRKIWNIL